jgi:hypothetical protein
MPLLHFGHTAKFVSTLCPLNGLDDQGLAPLGMMRWCMVKCNWLAPLQWHGGKVSRPHDGAVPHLRVVDMTIVLRPTDHKLVGPVSQAQ